MIHVYISFDFLINFFNSEPEDFNTIKNRIWLDMYLFLANPNFRLCLNRQPHPFESRTFQPLLKTHSRKLWKTIQGHYYENKNVEVRELGNNQKAETFSFFFQDEMNLPIKKTGYFYCNSTLKEPKLQLFLKKKTLSISRYENINQLLSWQGLNQFILPFHSLVVADNYLLTGRTIQVVSEYLKTLLSNNSSGAHLTLISNLMLDKKRYDSNSINQKKKDALTSFNKIVRELMEFDVKISLILLNHNYEFHDRIIITNSQILISGNSLHNYFHDNGKPKLNSPTLLTIASLVNRQDGFSYSKFTNEILNLFKGKIRSKKHTKHGNPEDNPLFRLKSLKH